VGDDIFMWVMVGIFVLLILFILGLGMFYPGSGAEQLGWKPTRSPELEAQNEVDDLDQMLEAANRRRRKRGAAELTETDMHARVREDTAMRDKLRTDHIQDRELEQLLADRNAKREARGLPAMSLDELRASLDVPRPPRGEG
jgi:hypothetical protein